MKNMKRLISSGMILMMLLLVGTTSRTWGAPPSLILAASSSTKDSGLLDALIPVFEKETGYQVKTIVMGSGQALKMGERGEADVLLVHSPDAEKKFMADGFGKNRQFVMYNDFIIVGPKDDPAGIKGLPSSAEAFGKIANIGAPFISRGDNSGTHAKEMAIWKKSGIAPEGQTWYQQTGLGMGQTLGVASEKKGYTLIDRGTYLATGKGLGLVNLQGGDPLLVNVYHVIEVNPAKWPKVNGAGAKAFADFMVSKKLQMVIGRFGVKKYGTQLFFPGAGKNPESLGH